MRSASFLAAVLLATAGVLAGVLPYPARSARADEVTGSGSSLRTGWDSAETTGSLAPSTLLSGSFGELFSAQVSGQVYAQPLVVGNTVIVATENDWVYGLDAATGAIKWSTSLGTPWPAATGHCTALTPNIGITGTPVYDPTITTATPNGAIYLVADVLPSGNPVTQPVYYMEALDPTTGAELPGWPVPIQGSPSNDPTAQFNAFTQLERPALLLLGGSVYAAFGGNCDYAPYDGYVVGVNTSTKATTLWTDEAGLTSQMAGIWQSGGGLLSDGPGRIFFTSGNGVSPAPGPGSSPPAQLAESVVRLAVQSNGTLAAQDFFSPANAPYLDSIDGDFGAGGPIGLPFGTAALNDLIVQIGKDGRAFVLNANNLGGREQGPKGTDAAVSVSGPYAGQWGHPAAFADTPVLSTANVAASNDYVYYVGKNAALFYLKAGLGTDGLTPVLSNVAQSDQAFGYTAGSPVVTSDGTNPASAVVWVINTSGETGTTGALEAYPAVPPPPSSGTCSVASECSVAPIWQYPLTGVGKFTTPATDNGRLYIGTRGAVSNGTNCPTIPKGTVCGRVLGFGSPSSAPLAGTAPVTFTNVPVGTMSTATSVTVSVPALGSPVNVSQPTASGNGFAVAGPFIYTPSGGSPTPVATWPQLMNPGDTLEAEGVTFTPAVPGTANGALQFGTDSVNFPLVSVPMSGNGTQAGFYSPTSSVNFGSQVPVNTTVPVQVTVSNDSLDPQTLTASGLSAPFSLSGLPTTAIAAGTSVSLTVGYHPTAPPTGTPDTATLTLTGVDGTTSTPPVSISLTGTSVADVVPTLTPTPTSVNFGSVHLGQGVQQVITVTNSGNLPAVVTATAPPAIPFGNPDPITNGLPVTPGYTIQIPVTFAPTSVGAVSGTYGLTWTDAAGTHQLNVPVTGTGAAPSGGIAIPPPGGGWTLNGSAKMTGTSLSLTQVAKDQAGSAVYSVPVPSDGLKASFTVQMSGGTGADGMTLSLLDATKSGLTALGGTGGLLGFGGLHGVAVTLDTSKDGSDYPSSNFVGISTNVKGSQLTFATTAKGVPALRTGKHVVGVSVSGSTVKVTVDGKQYLDRTVTMPKSVLVAFTAATGSGTDNHVVTGATITAGGNPIPQPGGGWSYNGSAGMSGSDTVLTPAKPSQAGTVIYPVAMTATGLRATFNVQLSGGSGGDGMTFALLDPTQTKATSVGGKGSLLGLGGLPGVSVMLGTDHTQAGWPGTDFVALNVAEGGGTLVPQYVAQAISSLRGGTHTVTVSVVNGGALGEVVTVSLDGVRMLQESEPTLTPTVLLAFTAGTGSTTTDLQIVRNASLAASSTAASKRKASTAVTRTASTAVTRTASTAVTRTASTAVTRTGSRISR